MRIHLREVEGPCQAQQPHEMRSRGVLKIRVRILTSIFKRQWEKQKNRITEKVANVKEVVVGMK